MTDTPVYDLAIIGGGINGCGIARDGAGRGLSVYLCEMNDLASGTSSQSTKLIHGGLRYLEYYEFRLVREALIEREVLWAIAPHIIRPLRVILPHRKGLRPAWLLRLGLFVYDHLGGRDKLPATSNVAIGGGEFGAPLAPGLFTTAFEYSDCTVDDARLVILNAMDAREHGAVIETRTRAMAAVRCGGQWEVSVRCEASGTEKTIHARTLVNAAGAWVANFISQASGVHSKARVRLVQGSHIVVPRLYAHDRAYMLQNPDGRIVFVIPYLDGTTLIGTTERDFEGDPSAVAPADAEIAYLCDSVSANFTNRITPQDVTWSFSGVRPLYDDGAKEAKAATREYVFEVDGKDGEALLLSIFGGKITTYRRLAEHAIERLLSCLPPDTSKGARAKAGWTGVAPLPGGDIGADELEQFEALLSARYPFLARPNMRRLVRSYGTRTSKLLGNARSAGDLGQHFGAGLTEAEVRYLMAEEWANSVHDIVWRRSKFGLQLSPMELAALGDWLRRQAAF